MQIIDVDSHVTVVKGLEDSPFQIKVLPDGGHLMEFSGARIDLTPPQGKTPRPHKPPIDIRTTWDLDRRLADLDQEGIDQQVLIFHTSHVFYGAAPTSQIISINDLAWQEMQPGVRMKPLWTDEKTNRRAVLGRIEPGVQPSRHRHVGDELVFVLEGALADEFGTVTAGNVGYRPHGCVHAVSSPQGATVLAIITGGIEPAKEIGSAPPSQVFILSELPQVEALPGVWLKQIWEDKTTARRAILARFEPDASLPAHRHVGDELIFVIEGASVDESGSVTPENLNYRPNGCVHTVTTRNGATVFAVAWGHVEPVS